MISGGEKNAISLHLAAISTGKKCFEDRKTQGFEISGTAEALYFASDNAFLKRFKRPNGRKSKNFNKKAVLAFEKHDFECAKLEF